MKVLFGRSKPGVAQQLADEFGETVKFWPYSTFGRGRLVKPRRKRRGRKSKLRVSLS